MKSTKGWYGDGNGTNFSGFSAPGAGFRNEQGYFNMISEITLFWTNTKGFAGSYYWNRWINYSDQKFDGWENGIIQNGYSVRCIKN